MNHLPENPEETDSAPAERGFLQRWSQRKSADAQASPLQDDEAETVPAEDVAEAEQVVDSANDLAAGGDESGDSWSCIGASSETLHLRGKFYTPSNEFELCL